MSIDRLVKQSKERPPWRLVCFIAGLAKTSSVIGGESLWAGGLSYRKPTDRVCNPTCNLGHANLKSDKVHQSN